MKFKYEKEFEDREAELEQSCNLINSTVDYVIIRLDGNSFSNFIKSFFGAIYDYEFTEMMSETAQFLHRTYESKMTYVHSDEISIVLKAPFIYGGRLQKLISIIASRASSYLTMLLITKYTPKEPSTNSRLFAEKSNLIKAFDARVTVIVKKSVGVLDNIHLMTRYFIWRYGYTRYNGLHALCRIYLDTINKDKNRDKITSQKLNDMSEAKLLDLLQKHEILRSQSSSSSSSKGDDEMNSQYTYLLHGKFIAGRKFDTTIFSLYKPSLEQMNELVHKYIFTDNISVTQSNEPSSSSLK